MARRGRPWTEDDLICAKFLRHCGLSNEDIGKVLKRSKPSIDGKIGPSGKSCYHRATLFEDVRPAAARILGAIADDFQTVGTA